MKILRLDKIKQNSFSFRYLKSLRIKANYMYNASFVETKSLEVIGSKSTVCTYFFSLALFIQLYFIQRRRSQKAPIVTLVQPLYEIKIYMYIKI